MSAYTTVFEDNYENWSKALYRTLENPSYKKFLEITSQNAPIVVANKVLNNINNDKSQCHLNCELAEADGHGQQVSGWYLMNEFLFNECESGICRLIHHSILLLPNGEYINITDDEGRSHHIFLPDPSRRYDMINNIGFNDRMVFDNNFMKGKDAIQAVPRNKVLYACNEYYDRDASFEKFRMYNTEREAMESIPKGLSRSEQDKWLTLKTNIVVS
jgi:hypothetical protein